MLKRTKRPFRRLANRTRGACIGLLVDLGFRPLRGYMICGSARTGSGYFTRLLSSTGELGKPREYFNTGMRRRFNPDYPTDPVEQLSLVMTEGATPNRVYGLKFFPTHFRFIKGRVDPFRDLPNLTFIHLRRRDVLGQAISLARARQTKQYGARPGLHVPATYDQAMIRRSLVFIATQEKEWRRILRQLGVKPPEFVYEEIMADPQGAVDRVASLMGLRSRPAIDYSAVTRAIQRDQLSAEWRHRFLEETGDQFRHLAVLASPRVSDAGVA